MMFVVSLLVCFHFNHIAVHTWKIERKIQKKTHKINVSELKNTMEKFIKKENENWMQKLMT